MSQNIGRDVDPTQGQSAFRPAFGWLIAATVAVGFLVSWGDGPSYSNQPADSKVSAEFSGIPVPPWAHAEKKEADLQSKAGAILVANRYSADLSPPLVLKRYHDALTAIGWTHRMRIRSISHSYDGKYSGDSYCKGNLLADIEIIGAKEQASEYAVSVSWSSVSERTCSSK